MADFQKRRSPRAQLLRVFLGTLGLLALLLVATLSARAAWRLYGKFAQAADDDATTQAELATLKTQYANVQATVESLNTPRGVEGAVRERYGAALPGEGEIDIVRSQPTTTPAAAGSGSLWSKLYHAIFVW